MNIICIQTTGTATKSCRCIDVDVLNTLMVWASVDSCQFVKRLRTGFCSSYDIKCTRQYIIRNHWLKRGHDALDFCMEESNSNYCQMIESMFRLHIN
jgi:hypothetical protein